MKKLFLISILSLLTQSITFAQLSSIKGMVYEKGSGEPVLFTSVYLAGTKYGASTDINGFYNITRIPLGNYILTVTHLGYDTVRIPITLKDETPVQKKIFLSKSTVNLSTVNIKAEKVVLKQEINTSVTKITPLELSQIPTVGGQAEIAQYLQVVPGVIFTGDQGGQLYIRGGSPVQNKVLLDGMIIYNPFHSIGMFSVFDADIIRSADVYTGGFNAEYGGRISAIMDIKTRDGNKNKISGSAMVNTFGSKLMLEGPIQKPTEEGGSGSSFVFSAKNSFLDKSSKTLYKYVDQNGIPYNFNDYYGKVTFFSGNGSKINAFGFNFNDNVNYLNLSQIGWKSYGGGSSFLLIPGNSNVVFDGIFAYSSYNISMNDNISLPKTSDISGFNSAMNFTYYEGKNEYKYGVELLGFKTDFQFYNSINRAISEVDNNTEAGAYFKGKFNMGKFILEPGLRIHYYPSLATISPEPRLSAKFNINDIMRIKVASGFYSQNLLSGSSDKDVVNLFYGFVASPQSLPDQFNGKDINNSLQKARHLIIGYEIDPFENFNINIEGYIKDFYQLININDNKLYDDIPDYSDKPDVLKKDFVFQSGIADGVDFSFKYETKRWYLWTVYSLGYITQNNGTTTYYPHYDRRHNINFVASYKFGKSRNWEFDARWNFGSGFPFETTQGIYQKLNFADGLNTNYLTANGDLAFIYNTTNQGRLPTYHRLDITLKKRFLLKHNIKIDGVISVINVYDRANIFYIDRVRNIRINQFPILPTAGITVSF